MDTLNVQSSTADNLGTRREYLGSRYTFLLSATVPLLHVIAPRNWTSHLLRLLVWIFRMIMYSEVNLYHRVTPKKIRRMILSL